MGIKEKIKNFLGLTSIQKSKEIRSRVDENIAETRKMLTVDGKDEWMLNLCKTKMVNGGLTKECYPNDEGHDNSSVRS